MSIFSSSHALLRYRGRMHHVDARDGFHRGRKRRGGAASPSVLGTDAFDSHVDGKNTGAIPL